LGVRVGKREGDFTAEAAEGDEQKGNSTQSHGARKVRGKGK